MHWIATSEKDSDNAALEKRLWGRRRPVLRQLRPQIRPEHLTMDQATHNKIVSFIWGKDTPDSEIVEDDVDEIENTIEPEETSNANN